MSKKSRWGAAEYGGKFHLYDRLSRMDFVPLCEGGPLTSIGTVGQYITAFYRGKGKQCRACLTKRDEITREERRELDRLREIESAAQAVVKRANQESRDQLSTGLALALGQLLQALNDKDRS